jgi:predicted nucleotidyltransferase/HEPN domain-containing protein
MKTTLPIKSKDHQARIKEITDIIVNIGKDKIAFVILFGSFARGDWVYHTYQEDGIIYNYASDYDLLIITKAKKHANLRAAYKLEDKIKLEIGKRELDKKHSVTLIIEALDKVNSELEKDRYFFSDIKKEGILLYSSGEFELSKPKKLSEEEIKEIAADNYQHWFGNGQGFINQFRHAVNDKDYKIAAFNLHQATESFYHCTLLVLTGYKQKTHDLEKLGKLCAAHSSKFLTIFPQINREQSKCFKLLKAAYIEARYNKDYKISEEQLKYLIKRIEYLKEITQEICKSKI